MSRSLYWKITIPFALLVLVSMGILGFYMVNSSRNIQVDHLRSQMLKQARLVADASLPSLLEPAKQVNLDILAKTTGKEIDARVTIIARDGTVLGDTEEDPSTMGNHSTRPEVIAALASGMGESTRYSTTVGRVMMYIAVPIISQGNVSGIARVALPMTAVESSVNSAVFTIGGATAIASLLVILAAALIARMITRPVRHLTKAAQGITSGQLGRQIPVQTNDELGQLGQAFNEMSVSLKNMMATISGEKTKLGLDLQGGLEVILEAQGDVSGDKMDQAEMVVRNRVDKLGVSEPAINRQGTNQISVGLAGVKNVEEAMTLIGKTALLEFKKVDPDMTQQLVTGTLTPDKMPAN